MPRKISVTQEDIDWLWANHEISSYGQIAKRLGCCVDTAKRVLARHGMQEFDSAKYVTCPSKDIEMWSRPCMGCKTKQPRPKGLYFCETCRPTDEDEYRLGV